jgi:hypothetical protein
MPLSFSMNYSSAVNRGQRGVRNMTTYVILDVEIRDIDCYRAFMEGVKFASTPDPG